MFYKETFLHLTNIFEMQYEEVAINFEISYHFFQVSTGPETFFSGGIPNLIYRVIKWYASIRIMKS